MNIYQNELDKAYFQHDMAYGYFKDLPRRKVSDEILVQKAFNIDKNPEWWITWTYLNGLKVFL